MQCWSVPTTCKYNPHPICIHRAAQKAFVGPHHLSKISGQKPPINHLGDSNERNDILQ